MNRLMKHRDLKQPLFLLSLCCHSNHLQKPNTNLECHQGTITPEMMLGFVKSYVDYNVGPNPMKTSYLVGNGPKYPTRVHHRGASITPFNEHKGFLGCT